VYCTQSLGEMLLSCHGHVGKPGVEARDEQVEDPMKVALIAGLLPSNVSPLDVLLREGQSLLGPLFCWSRLSARGFARVLLPPIMMMSSKLKPVLSGSVSSRRSCSCLRIDQTAGMSSTAGAWWNASGSSKSGMSSRFARAGRGRKHGASIGIASAYRRAWLIPTVLIEEISPLSQKALGSKKSVTSSAALGSSRSSKSSSSMGGVHGCKGFAAITLLVIVPEDLAIAGMLWFMAAKWMSLASNLH